VVSLLDAIRQLVQSASFFAVLGLTAAGWLDGYRERPHGDIGHGALLAGRRFGSTADCAWAFLDSAQAAQELYRLGSQFTIMTVSSQLSNNADSFILTALLGPGSLSLYRPPSQIMALFAPVVLTLGNQLHRLRPRPTSSATNRTSRRILFRGTKYTMLIGSVFCAIMISLAGPICKVWLGKVLGGEYKVCAAVLMIEQCILSPFCVRTQWPVLLGMKITRFAAYGRIGNLRCSTSRHHGYWCAIRRWASSAWSFPPWWPEILWRPCLSHHACRAVDLSVRAVSARSISVTMLIGGAVAAMGFGVRLLRRRTISGVWSDSGRFGPWRERH